MQALLSFDRAPPFSAPLRFFLAGPLFGMLAGLLTLVAGPELLSSRWTAAALAATHLLTVGFMLQVMLGALLQILPVMAGANVPSVLLVAKIVQGCIALGALFLSSAFLVGQPWLFVTAVVVLGGGVLIFMASAGIAVWRVPVTSPTILGLRLAMVGLLGVCVLGGGLALALANGWAVPLVALVNLHVAWGLAGWVGILLASLAFVVVPMFQLTPGYLARFGWWWPGGMMTVVVLWSVGVLFGMGDTWFLVIVVGFGMALAGYTLYLHGQRRRARTDALARYWQMGLILVLAALAMLLVEQLFPVLSSWERWPVLFGIVFLAGGIVSLITGMLYKIVPFMAWLHLQNQGQGRVPAPNMTKLLPDRLMLHQWWSQAVATVLLVLAVFFPEVLARPAGAAWMLANGWLLFNLWQVIRRYLEHQRLCREKLGTVQ